MTSELQVPERRVDPARVNPKSLVIVGPSQCGKTSACAALPDTLLVELQPGGSDYVPGCWALTFERDVPTDEAFIRWLDHLAERRKAGKPIARRIVIDHLGYLDEAIWRMALERFTGSPQGQAFNKAREAARQPPIVEITELPGPTGSSGWKWLRDEMSYLRTRIELAADEVVYIGHLRDKFVGAAEGVSTGMASPQVTYDMIDLTGAKTRRLFVSESSGVALAFRRRGADGSDEFVLNFKSEGLSLACSRCPHLAGREFVVGKSVKGGLPVFDWGAIYLDKRN